MDLLGFLTDEELIQHLQCKKTEITSYIKKPLTFLNQLRDNKLVTENLYQKVKKMKNKQEGVYEILEQVENKSGQHVRKFWRCMFQNHILREYPRLRRIKKRLLDGSDQIALNPPDTETPSSNTEVERKKKKQEQKKGATKGKKSGKEMHKEKPGPSSVSKRKKLAMNPKLSKHLKKGELPVTCGVKKGTLYKDKLAGGKECILSEGRWFTTGDFERFSGREKSKNWKLSIRCENITLHKLIQEGKLLCRNMKKVRFPSGCVESSSPRQYIQAFIL